MVTVDSGEGLASPLLQNIMILKERKSERMLYGSGQTGNENIA